MHATERLHTFAAAVTKYMHSLLWCIRARDLMIPRMHSTYALASAVNSAAAVSKSLSSLLQAQMLVATANKHPQLCFNL